MKKPSNPQLKQSVVLALGAVACGFLCASAQAQIVVTTSGSSNPTAAGYSEVFSAGPPVITTGGGTDTENYWYLHTGPFPGDSGGGHYLYSLGAGQDLDPSGWTFTFRAKAVNADRNFESYWALVGNGGNAWIITLVGGPDAGSTPGMHYYRFADGGAFPTTASTLPGSSDPSLAYHTYQMVYNPGTTSVSFYIDGAFSTSQPASDTVFAGGVGASRIEFGDGQGTGAPTGSETRFSLVQFEIGQHVIPEPSSIALLCLGGLSLAISRRRNGKSC